METPKSGLVITRGNQPIITVAEIVALAETKTFINFTYVLFKDTVKNDFFLILEAEEEVNAPREFADHDLLYEKYKALETHEGEFISMIRGHVKFHLNGDLEEKKITYAVVYVHVSNSTSTDQNEHQIQEKLDSFFNLPKEKPFRILYSYSEDIG